MVGGTKSYIRLINPPYCAYDCKFNIEESDTGEVLYQSDTIESGTVIEYVGRNRNAAYGETQVCATLQFFRCGKDRVIREKEKDKFIKICEKIPPEPFRRY